MPKFGNFKIFGHPIFQRSSRYTQIITINMYLFFKIHSPKNWVSCRAIFEGLGVQMTPSWLRLWLRRRDPLGYKNTQSGSNFKGLSFIVWILNNVKIYTQFYTEYIQTIYTVQYMICKDTYWVLFPLLSLFSVSISLSSKY